MDSMDRHAMEANRMNQSDLFCQRKTISQLIAEHAKDGNFQEKGDMKQGRHNAPVLTVSRRYSPKYTKDPKF